MAKRHKPSFDDHYLGIFGERWIRLRDALTGPKRLVAYADGLLKPYFLDAASLAGVSLLDVRADDCVLDLCAAPGGKTLVIASLLGADGRLVANELSSTRRFRLARVLSEHLDADRLGRIRISGHDASRWGLYEQAVYTKILADVPCSGERHLIETPAEYARWSPGRTERLAIQAYAILASAFTALKPGGRLVYSTCSLSPTENDEVIAKLSKRKAGEFTLETAEIPEGERTAYGCRVLPDRAAGAGPFYAAVVVKNRES